MINEGVLSSVLGSYGRVCNVDIKKFTVNEVRIDYLSVITLG